MTHIPTLSFRELHALKAIALYKNHGCHVAELVRRGNFDNKAQSVAVTRRLRQLKLITANRAGGCTISHWGGTVVQVLRRATR